MERFSIVYSDYYQPVDNKKVLEQVAKMSYEEDFIELTNKDFLYYIFDNVNQSLVGYVLAGVYKNFEFFEKQADCICIYKLEVFTEQLTKNINYQNQGFGTLLLNLVTKTAKDKKIPFICLYATDLSYKYYFSKNFISLYDKKVMIQIVDTDIKIYATILRESLNRALHNKTSLEKELLQIIKNKDYSSLLEYEIIKERKYQKDSAYKNFCKIDQLITNKVLKSKLFPLIMIDLQNKMDKCYYKKEDLYKLFEFKSNGNTKLDLIYNAMHLLEQDHLVNKNNCFIIS